jgi:hypothetical protein
MNKYEYYEQMKQKIAAEAKTQEEYEKRVRALAEKLKL